MLQYEANIINSRRKDDDVSLAAVGVGVGASLFLFALARYHTSKSNEWLVRTGLGIKDMQIGKKFVRWPFQVFIFAIIITFIEM